MAIAAVIVLLPAAAFSIWDAFEARRVAHDVQEILRRGEPVTLAGRAAVRNMTAEQREAARLYYAAAMLASGISRGSLQPRVQPAPLGDTAERTRTATELLTQLAAGRADEAALPALEAVYAPAAPAFALIERAAPLNFSAFTLDRAPYSYLTNDLLTLRALNAIRTDVLTWRGDGAAVAAHVASIRLERTVPAMWSRGATTGSLTLLLARHSVDADGLRRLQAAYETTGDPSLDEMLYLRTQVVESLWPDTFSQPLHLQRLRLRVGRERASELMLLPLRPWLTRQLHEELQRWEEAIEVVKRPWPGRREAVRALAERHALREKSRGSSFGVMDTPAPIALVGEIVPRAAALLARNRTAATAVAVERYRLDHAGALPPTLEGLVPAYLNAVPQDPFVGGPIRLARNADGYAVYSVGTNSTDDGGDVDPYHPDAAWSYRSKSRDLGIRVPLRPIR